jgi:hypothetical protein
MKALLNNLGFFVFTLGAATAFAQQSSSELTCRAKAKEIASQAYSGCTSEAKKTQIDQIRKDYQKQLTDLKAKYDRELKKLSGKGSTNAMTTKSAPNTMAASASTGSTPKATKGIARTLPTRKEVKNTAPSTQPAVQEVQESEALITPETTNPGGEAEPTQNDAHGDLKIELAPAPASSDKTAASSDDQTY